MTQWQDIASAPKDGTRILVCAGHGHVFIALWEAPYGGVLLDEYPFQWCRDAHDDWDAGDFTPTAWMPLPTPPDHA